MTIDNGDWLSAEQAVLPDGSERTHLWLVNKKLPPLAPTSTDPTARDSAPADAPGTGDPG